MSSSTFSAASARLVSRGVASRTDVEAVEALLDQRLPGQPIEPGDLRQSGVGADTLGRILVGYVEEGQLVRREHVRCPECKLLEEASSVEEAVESGRQLGCSNCDE